MEDIIYFELNNWFAGRDYPNADPFKKWIAEYQFTKEQWVKDNGLVVVCGPYDMSINYCISAPRKWVEENCPDLLSDKSTFVTMHYHQATHNPPDWEVNEEFSYKDYVRETKDGELPESRLGMPFMEYSEENIGVHWAYENLDNKIWEIDD